MPPIVGYAHAAAKRTPPTDDEEAKDVEDKADEFDEDGAGAAPSTASSSGGRRISSSAHSSNSRRAHQSSDGDEEASLQGWAAGRSLRSSSREDAGADNRVDHHRADQRGDDEAPAIAKWKRVQPWSREPNALASWELVLRASPEHRQACSEALTGFKARAVYSFHWTPERVPSGSFFEIMEVRDGMGTHVTAFRCTSCRPSCWRWTTTRPTSHATPSRHA